MERPALAIWRRPRQDRARPALLVIQEWWGLNDQIKKTADRLAEAGYRALVPDFYRGKVATASDEANHLMTNLNFPMPPIKTSAARAVPKTILEEGGRGRLLHGGALTLLAAVRVPEIDAGACFYAFRPRCHELKKLNSPDLPLREKR